MSDDSAAPARPAADAPPVPPRRGGGLALLLSLLVAAGAGAGGHWLWQEQQRQQAELSRLHAQLDSALARERREAAAQLTDALAATARRADRLEALQRELEGELTALRARLDGGPQRWLTVAEAEYLLRAAQRRLELFADPAGAARLLRAADRTLEASAEADYLPVRQAIAAALERLGGAGYTPATELAARIALAADAADTLPLAHPGAAFAAERAREAADRPAGLSDWRGLLATVWGEVRSLVRISRADAAPEPVMGPDRQFFLRHNLRLQLESARLAALAGDQATLRAGLDRADAWLARWFDDTAPALAAVRAELGALAAAPLHPEWPDVSRPLAELHALGAALAAAEAP